MQQYGLLPCLQARVHAHFLDLTNGLCQHYDDSWEWHVSCRRQWLSNSMMALQRCIQLVLVYAYQACVTADTRFVQGALAPFAASAALFAGYLVVKFFPNLNLQAFLNLYFWLIGSIAIFGALQSPLRQSVSLLGYPSSPSDVSCIFVHTGGLIHLMFAVLCTHGVTHLTWCHLAHVSCILVHTCGLTWVFHNMMFCLAYVSNGEWSHVCSVNPAAGDVNVAVAYFG